MRPSRRRPWFAPVALWLSAACSGSGGAGATDGGTVDGTVDAIDAIDAAPPGPFRFLSAERETCPATGFDCTTWPPAASGTMWKMTSEERRAGDTLERTFHVYVPARVTGRVPLVVFLHGGAPATTTAALDQLARSYDELADGRPVSWRRNTANCQLSFPLPPLFNVRFEDSGGQVCLPPAVSVTGNQPFILVLPDGLHDDPLDPASTHGQHWEDGRVPSPGQVGDVEHRDDVGFIDHVLDVLAQRPDVDPERLTVMGASNGGMMVQRLACHVDEPRTPRLGKVAAFAAQVAALPEPIAAGLAGRETCPTHGPRPVPIAFFVGNGVDTPQCASGACTPPTINGDSRMPYGVAGGVYTVNSPDSGRVIAADDAHRRWIAYALASGAGPLTRTTTTMGFFTSIRTTTFASSPARVVVYETTGGLHGNTFSRNDYLSVARPLEFVLSFRLDAAGALRYEPAAGSFAGTW